MTARMTAVRVAARVTARVAASTAGYYSTRASGYNPRVLMDKLTRVHIYHITQTEKMYIKHRLTRTHIDIYTQVDKDVY